MIRWNFKILGKSHLPVMIFLHGFLGSLEDWLPLARRFSSDYRCFLLDLPGHGSTESNRDSDYSMSNTTKSLIELLDDQKIERAVLVGYSMGGRLALHLAIHYPQYFGKVILESASPGLQKSEERLARRKIDTNLANEMEIMTAKNFLHNWYNQPLFNSLRTHPKFDEMFNQRLSNNSANWPASLRGMGVGRQSSLWNRLENLDMPILILAGEKDQKFSNIASLMKEHNQDFTISIIAQCGHVIHLEDEDRFYAEVNKFLTDKGEIHE